jgi:hypothetical protein
MITPEEERHLRKIGEEFCKRFAGEVLADNSVARMWMSPEERRLIPPWETESVPEDLQISLGQNEPFDPDKHS